MVRPVVLICVMLIIALDGVAVYLGIQANNAQHKGRHSIFVLECQTKGHHEAYRMGVGAAISLSLAHLLANLLACAACSRSSPHFFDTGSGKLVALLFVLSWIACGFGLTFFIQGALHNKKSGFSCGVDILKKHLLIYGVFASIVHGVSSGAFCLLAGWIGGTNGDAKF